LGKSSIFFMYAFVCICMHIYIYMYIMYVIYIYNIVASRLFSHLKLNMIELFPMARCATG
jgi:hypothetical protein